MNTHRALIVVTLLVPSLSGATRASAPSAYERVLQQIDAAAQRGAHQRALTLARGLVARYSQDYRATMKLAWLAFEGRDYELALRSYRRASALSAGSYEARLGIAWSLLESGDRLRAEHAFSALRKRYPSSSSVSAGLVASAAKPTGSVSPLLSFGYQGYDGNLVKRWAMSSLFGLRLAGQNLWALAAYRYSYFFVTDTALSHGIDDFDFHETLFSVGYGTRAYGLSASYAYLYDGSDFYDYAHLGGASLRLSPWGDILLGASYSAYSDLSVASGTLSWRLPFGPVDVTPGIEVQYADGEPYAAASLSLSLRRRWFSLALGGVYGERQRPVDFDQLSIYSTPETVAYGGWASVALSFSRFGLSLTYAADRFIDGSGSESVAHFLTLGLSVVAGRFGP